MTARPPVDEGRQARPDAAAPTVKTARYCHGPGRVDGHCSIWPMRGEDYCKKHLALKASATGASVPSLVPPSPAEAPLRLAVDGPLFALLEQVLASRRADVEALARTRAILQGLPQ